MRTEPDKSLQYIASLFAPEDVVLSESSQAAIQTGAYGMQLGAVEGKLLQLLISLSNAKKILEIGCFMGYSCLWMARALPEDGQIITIEQDKNHAQQAAKHFAMSEQSHKITLKEGKALDVLPSCEVHGPFDLIFIDADKGGYVSYLDWAEKNLRKNGLIIGDNTLLFGNVYEDKPQSKRVSVNSLKVMKEFNQRLADERYYQSILIPTYEGLTVAMKRF
jgi:predicted O-methyltransferase YrrM